MQKKQNIGKYIKSESENLILGIDDQGLNSNGKAGLAGFNHEFVDQILYEGARIRLHIFRKKHTAAFRPLGGPL